MTRRPIETDSASAAGGVRSVIVVPGCTTVTLIPCGPSSSARFLVNAETATLRTRADDRARLARGEPADVDDPAPAVHVRHHGPRAAQVAAHLDRQVRLEVVLAEAALVRRRGGVDEDVHAAERVLDRRHHRGHALVRARVRRHRERADFPRRGGERLLAAGDDRHARALADEGARGRQPDAPAAARDDRPAAVRIRGPHLDVYSGERTRIFTWRSLW